MMDSHDLDDLIEGARQIRQAVAELYKDVTDEELDLESAVRHFPLMALGLAVGAGAIAGWWLGRRAPQLPPPPEPKPTFTLERLEKRMERVRDRLPEITVSDELKAAARKWYSTVVEPKVRENLETVHERGFSGLIDHAARHLDSKQEKRLPDPEADASSEESPGAEDLSVDRGKPGD